jgi:hypothetical protein
MGEGPAALARIGEVSVEHRTRRRTRAPILSADSGGRRSG